MGAQSERCSVSQENKVTNLRGKKNRGGGELVTGDWKSEKALGVSLRSGLQVHRAWWGTQGPDSARLSSVSHTPHTGFHRTPLPSSPPQGDYTPLPEPHLSGDCAPLSHVLDEGQELLLSPEQMKEERL